MIILSVIVLLECLFMTWNVNQCVVMLTFYCWPSSLVHYWCITFVTVPVKTCIVHLYWEKTKIIWELRMLQQVFTGFDEANNWWNFKALNQQNLFIILLAWPWKFRESLFCFHSPKGKGVAFVCLQSGRHKQNHPHSFGRTAFMHEHPIDLEGYYWSLFDWPTTGKQFNPNPSALDKYKLKL